MSPHLTIRSASLLSFYGPQNLLIDTESQVDTEPEHLSPVSTPTSRSPCSPHGKALQAVARSNPSSEPLHIFSPTTRDAGMQGLVRSVSAGLPWGIAAESYPCSPPLPVKSVGLCAAGDAWAWRQRCSPTYCFCPAARGARNLWGKPTDVSNSSHRKCSEGGYTCLGCPGSQSVLTTVHGYLGFFPRCSLGHSWPQPQGATWSLGWVTAQLALQDL